MNQGLEILSRANSNWLFESNATKWTSEENKQFENALALFDKDTPDRWYDIAAMIPGKTVNDVIKQYKELEEDISVIEAGLIPVPGYASDHSFEFEWINNQGFEGLKQFYAPGGKRSSSDRTCDQERKKGVAWTEEEHRQFLRGLKKYGKGDWRNISRNVVTSRTPTQVASHAQKYFIRQLSGGKDKRRSSIHDITTVNLADAKSTSPDNNKPPSPNKLIAVVQHQQDSSKIGMGKALHDWNMQNQGAVMAFDMPNRMKIEAFNKNSTSELRKSFIQGPQFGL
ncbi:Transcription factor DIVARICATA [Heracleum sosnowskyi]|uniref:Transcription factor DIVARICATA n=1 Tax=Heracleum sosnowskyi TaxID=360622 RepID=A0AAD8MER8_9APIA|nr:Transcription factor DIVARICATA [Heracleum sosnowskyi]